MHGRGAARRIPASHSTIAGSAAPPAGPALRRPGATVVSSGIRTLPIVIQGEAMSPGAITESQVLDALRSVMDPDLHRDIVEPRIHQESDDRGRHASRFDVNLTTPACPVKDRLRDQSREAVLAIPGVRDARVNMTSRGAPSGGARHVGAPEHPEHRRGREREGRASASPRSPRTWPPRSRRAARGSGSWTPTSTGPSIPIMMRSREAGRAAPEQHDRAGRGARRAGDVDGLPEPGRPAADLARPDGAQGGPAEPLAGELGRARLPDRRPAAGHRRRPPDAGPDGAGHRRGDRLDAAGRGPLRSP